MFVFVFSFSTLCMFHFLIEDPEMRPKDTKTRGCAGNAHMPLSKTPERNCLDVLRHRMNHKAVTLLL